MPLENQFVNELNLALRARRIQCGIAKLKEKEKETEVLDPEAPNAIDVVLLVAQWVDAGYRDYRFLDEILLRFSSEVRTKLSIRDYLKLRMAEGFRALASGEVDSAIEILDFVLRAQQDLPDEPLEAIVRFWKARAHRKKGEYQASLGEISRARELARRTDDSVFVAVIQIQEAWLLFQKGSNAEALRLLDEAESILRSTDHFVALGNIESARGRIVRRCGEYTNALEHFNRAIEIYAKGDPHHVNLARTLVNAAYVRRLLAIQLRRRIDSRAQLHRLKSGSTGRSSMPGSETARVRYQALFDEALLDLKQAREIYVKHAHFDGIGQVALNLGYLHLDCGDIDQASPEAAEAYRLGVQQSDHILMARARILEATIENAHVEEQMGEDVDAAVHASRARRYSDEALELAQGTQNRRLIAGAFLSRGLTAANDFYQDWDEARRCATEATHLIGPGENDRLVKDLAQLKSNIVQASGINHALRAWSEGMVGNKTFQQITEEFAEIVIPKVWLRENKRISRVANSLSISPKKVRRILRNAGAVRS
jgi:tetratricopeptide (TPR) repeat protein